MSMRIGTWNLQRGGRSGRRWPVQSAVVEALSCDVMVLTEAPSDVVAVPGRIVTSPCERSGGRALESWIALVGPGIVAVDLDIPFERMAAAATMTVEGRQLVVYGSVLPWSAAPVQAPRHARPGERADDMFSRVLAEQVDDIHRLRRMHPEAFLVWAGDFNQSLCGPNYGGSARRRAMLAERLEALGLVAWNASTAHARPPMCAIDLVCGPAVSVTSIHSISTSHDGQQLSDHLGYVVDISLMPAAQRS